MADTQEQATQSTQPVQSAQEAQTAQTAQTTETTQPAQPVAKELVQNEFWVSGMLNGTFYECDGPYYTTKDVPAENYPYTTIKPDPNFTSQKYDYINHKWVDTSADALLHEMESIRTAVNGFQQTATTLQQGFVSQSQAQEAKDEEAEKNMNLLSMVVKQMGAISEKIDGISTKLNDTSATTPVTKATSATATTPVTKATSATATTPVTKATPVAATTPVTKATPVAATTPVTKATPVAATTPVTKATPVATTTQTADETKKEGTN